MKLLLVASAPMELAPFRQRKIGNHEVFLTANGAGPLRAAAAVDTAMRSFRPDAILSMGFAGALDPILDIADIVVATSVNAAGRSFTAQMVQSGRSHTTGEVCSIDHVAGTATEKKRLHATGAVVVEMEAAGVAERAQTLGLPFFCIKTVTDLADETMSNDFNAALRSDGQFDTMKILASSLRKPWVRLPELLRLRSRCERAARSLGDFVADCRF